MTGGFRLYLGPWRVAFTSPLRIAAWAVAALAVRHWAVPRPPMYRDVPARVSAAWKAPGSRAARSAFLATRPTILAVGYLAVFMFGYGPRTGPPFRVFDNEVGNLQGRWDTGWYLGIAVSGYRYDATRPDGQQNIVFFPAYPMATRVVARLLGASSSGRLLPSDAAAYMIGGTLGSLVAFFGALVYLFMLAREMLGDDEEASAAVWLLAAYPFSLFYSAMYTESVFLLGTVGAFYHFRRGEFGRAAIWGAFTGLTRPNGCFICVPLGILALMQWLPAWLAGGPRSERTLLTSVTANKRLPIALLAAAAPVVGTAIYSAFIWQLTGDPFMWAKGHAAWGRSYNGLTVLVTQRYEWLSQGGLYLYTANMSGDLVNVLGAGFSLVCAWPVARKLGLAYAVFILINTLPPLAAGGFLSAGRLSSTMFPAFIWLATAVSPRLRTAWVANFMALQAFAAALFYTWRPLF